jgi:hypothetical protein
MCAYQSSPVSVGGLSTHDAWQRGGRDGLMPVGRNAPVSVSHGCNRLEKDVVNQSSVEKLNADRFDLRWIFSRDASEPQLTMHALDFL